MSSINTFATLYVNGSEAETESLTLFVDGLGIGTLGRTLYMYGRMLKDNGLLPLFISNDAIAETFPLHIKGDGFWPGFITYADSRTLFLYQQGVDLSGELFIHGHAELNSFTTLHLMSFETDNSNINLVVPNPSISLNTYTTLFIQGAISTTDNIDMFIDAHGVLNGDTTLFMKQNTITINTFAPMYIAGAYIDYENTTLVIPDVFDEDNFDIPLYVFGW